MERLKPGDLRSVSTFLGELYAFGDLDALVERLLTHLPRLVPSDLTVYGQLNVPQQRFKFVWDPAGAASKLVEAFGRHAMEHPFAQKYLAGGDGSAAKLSDLLTLRQFRQLGLYEEFFRRLGIDREMIAWLPTPRPLEITVGVHRSRVDFSERDRLLLDVLRPHLTQAYRNAEALTLIRQAATTNNKAVLLVSPAGQLENPDRRDLDLLAWISTAA